MTLSATDWAPVPVRAFRTGQRRFEGESYLTPGYAIKRNIERASCSSLPLRDVARIWMPNRLKATQVLEEHGVSFLAATQVFDAWPTPRKWLAVQAMKDVSTRYVEQGWLLVTRSGRVGDTTDVHDYLIGRVVSDDLLRVVPNDPQDRGWIYFFLRCRLGREMTRSSHYGSIIKHLQPEHLDAMPIVQVAGELRTYLSEALEKVTNARNEAYRCAGEAQRLLADAMTIEPHVEQSSVYVVTSKELSRATRRLDGFHYNPRAEHALRIIRESSVRVDELHTLTGARGVSGVPRFKHVYGESGTPYVDSEDLFKLNPEVKKRLPGVSKGQFGVYSVNAGWLLMACSGQLYGLNGSVCIATSSHEGRIISNHVLRLKPSPNLIRAGYLQTILSNPVIGRPLVQASAFGTEVPEIDPADIRYFPVPRLEHDLESAIADNSEMAASLLASAREVEDEATARLERELDLIVDA